MTIRGKWAWTLMALLVVSIGVNVFALGAFAAWRHMGPARFGGGMERSMDRETAEQARQYFKSAFKAHRDEIREAGRAIRQARRKAGETMRAETLDEQALAVDLEALQQANAEAQRVFEGVMIEAARAMPDELRRKVDWRFLGRRGHHRGKRGGPGH
ncbi:periplasmic heavy metal sensor [Tepidamorphus sp. 3E244]|uniref:periplasmic heavy metal sensor n=1 Tax=Tepidamorphus sp. 3E244 TaxID=3385498 RepID=UPI0038FC2C81